MANSVLEYNLDELETEDGYTRLGKIADKVLRETPKALLVVVDGAEQWLPRSQCRMDDEGGIWASDWILEKEGLL
jgi:hypothetical protein